MPIKSKKDLWVEMSIREIWTQTNFAGISYSHIDPKALANNDLVFSSIHSFLSHCAMVSKMLKAVDDEDPTKSIGTVLGIPDTSIIHKRKFRNNLEHYNNELKEWIRKFPIGSNIGTYNIGPKSAVQNLNMILVSHYDPSSEIFTFVNEDFNLKSMHGEVERIKIIADNWVRGIQFSG